MNRRHVACRCSTDGAAGPTFAKTRATAYARAPSRGHGRRAAPIRIEKKVVAASRPRFDLSTSREPTEPFRNHIPIVSTPTCAPEAFALRKSSASFRRARCSHADAPAADAGLDRVCRHLADRTRASLGQDPDPSINWHENVDQACVFYAIVLVSDSISWARRMNRCRWCATARGVDQLFASHEVKDRAERRPKIAASSTCMRLIVELKRSARRSRTLERYLDTCARSSAASSREAYTARRARVCEAPIGVPDSFEEHVKLMFDLQVLAFQADTTRVFAFKLGRDASNRVYPDSGVTTAFHSASHHQAREDRIMQFAKINRYHISMVPYFLKKLQETPDGDSNLLENSLIIYGSPMGDSNVHNHKRCRVLRGHAAKLRAVCTSNADARDGECAALGGAELVRMRVGTHERRLNGVQSRRVHQGSGQSS